ncbi:hypothetical protein DPMN_158527 [Dreissena polymorpha]|uniref:Uncharacterized protein n=2 Tax=Dreissena polymorpha TaxID=45954 RepID=A0A9D4EJ93_DREPO|nr:hypothetical protein DPMN_158527 [Dreissena polymorpha]
MDWCKIASEQSFVTMLPMDDKTTSFNSNTQMRDSNVFDDLTSLKDFKFVFHVQLRESVDQFDIGKIINEQIVDCIYSHKKDRKKAYILLNEIMKRERCLVLLDGLDEWIGTGDHHNLPILLEVHSHCVLLITTRPWKITEAKILDSQIDKLLQLDGVNNVYEVSRTILGCRKDCKDGQDLDKKQSEFESYVQKFGLLEHLYSPMMMCLIVQMWAEGTELKGSKCEMYSILLESLFKKAKSTNKKCPVPPFRCFTGTEYIQPNIEHLNRLAEAAFYLLFADRQEKALVFTNADLETFNLGQLDPDNFALKSGILSATHKAPALRPSSSFSFIHKSIQEFLAAYHIACNTNLIDEVISGYLTCHKGAYLGISQVFIFLCGLNMSAANKLSGMMDEHDVGCLQPMIQSGLQHVILAGYREAVANQQKDIVLKLSGYYLDFDYDIRDLHSIWTNNGSNVLALKITVPDSQSSPTIGESSSHIEFDLSSCIKLKSLELNGNGILLTVGRNEPPAKKPMLDRSISMLPPTPSPAIMSAPTSTPSFVPHQIQHRAPHPPPPPSHPGGTEGMSSPPRAGMRMRRPPPSPQHMQGRPPFGRPHGPMHGGPQHRGPGPGFHSETLFKRSPSLFEKCLQDQKGAATNKGTCCTSTSTAEHLVRIVLKSADPPPVLPSVENITLYKVTCSSTCLRSLFGTLLTLDHAVTCDLRMISIKCEETAERDICAFIHTDLNNSFTIKTDKDYPYLFNALHGLNIKSLSLSAKWRLFLVDHEKSLSQSLSSLKQLEKLSITVGIDSPGLWKAVYGLNIKSLSLIGMWEGFFVDDEESLKQSLSSLTQLETLSIELSFYSFALWEALHGLNIKSLSIDYRDLTASNVKSQSQSLASLTQLETLSVKVLHGSTGLWKALHGLNIKSLSVEQDDLNVDYVELSQSLASLTQLETLTLYVKTYKQLELPQSLKYLNLFCNALLPSKALELVDTLPTCTQKVGSNLKLRCSLEFLIVKNIPIEEYTAIQQELQTRKDVTVERFEISDGKLETKFLIHCQ